MDTKVTVAVFGVGQFGRHHVAALCRRQDVEVVALADRNERRARDVANTYGIPMVCTNLSELLLRSQPAGVCIATPAADHVSSSVLALERGSSVLVEKPIALSSADARRLLDVERHAVGFLLPGHVLRFSPEHVELRRSVAAGELGNVLAITAHRYRDRSHQHGYSDVHPALMTTIHDIDLALWVTGASPRRVWAFETPARPDERQPPCLTGVVESSDASMWTFHTAWSLPEGSFVTDRFEVLCTGGYLSIEGRSSLERHSASSAALEYHMRAALEAEIDHFVARLRDPRAQSPVLPSDALASVTLAEAMVASARKGGDPVYVL